MGYPTQARVAGVTHSVSEAVRTVHPRTRLIATGADADRFKEWNVAQLTNPPGTYDSLSTHFVVTDDVQPRRPSAEFRTLESLALPSGLEKQCTRFTTRYSKVRIATASITALTEWLMVSNSQTAPKL